MVGRPHLGEAAAVVLKDDEIQDVIEKATVVKQAFDQRFQFGGSRRGDFFARDRPPGHKAIPPAAEHARPRLQPVGNHQQFIGGKERRNVLLVGLQLVEGVVDRDVFIARILQFQHGQWQTVHVQRHIRAAIDLGPPGRRFSNHGELI